MAKNLFALCCLLMPWWANAAVSSWEIVPQKSTIKFIATQNNAPVTGEFKKFTGEINFDPAQLDASNVHIIVNMNSLSTSYSDLTMTLFTADWFDVKIFPNAEFKANHFTKIGTDKYQAAGTLTIRNKSQPVTLTFTAKEMPKNTATVQGSTELNRLAFGVGQGEWSSTDEVKDRVQVTFNVVAIKK